MGIKDEYKEKLAARIIKGLEKRNMEGFYCATKKDALKKALELIPKGASVSWGGSESIKEIGLIDAVKNGNYNVLDRSTIKSPEESKKFYKEAMFCDCYIGSSNAITYSGELVNIDGNGNRVAAYIFGPESVILITSLNKAEPDVESAIKRVKGEAAAPNCLRLGLNNPCAVTGVCGNCLNGTICCQEVITRYSRIKGRIKVVLVGEDAGF